MIETDGFGGITQAHQRIPKGSVEPLVGETQPDQRMPDPERDAGRDQHKDDDDPEHRARNVSVEQRDGQRAREIPQDRRERNDRYHRSHRAEQQGLTGANVRNICGGARTGGENIDVLLDTLVGIVNRFVDEPSPVVGVSGKPVGGQVIGEPHPPRDDEPLHQVEVDHSQGYKCRGEDTKDHQRHPKAMHA